MNRKLKIALRRRSSEQGFAIPIAVGMGLIMLLVGVTMIVRSQGDQVTASAQKATADSLGVAETGVTRVHALLKKFPILPAKPLLEWGTLPEAAYDISTGGACGSGGAVDVIPIPAASNQDKTLFTAIKDSSWTNVDSSDPRKGEFKVTYTPAGSAGTIRVEGRASSENTSATTKAGNATTVVEAEFPITNIPSTTQTPAIWVLGTTEFPLLVGTGKGTGGASIKGCVQALKSGSYPPEPYPPDKMSVAKLETNTPPYTFTIKPTLRPNLPDLGAIYNTTLPASVSTLIELPNSGDKNSAGVPYSSTPTGTYRYLASSGLAVSGEVRIRQGARVIIGVAE